MYSKDVLERLRKLGASDINNFFERVPDRDRRFILSIFRPPSGFRPNSDAAANILSHKLAARISGKSSQQTRTLAKDTAVMERMWEAWLRANLGDEEFVGQCLETWRDTLDSDEEGLSESDQVAAKAALFSSLCELTDRNLCGREDLELAFTFSPFDDSEDLARIIAKTKSRDEIREAQEFTMLPGKIANLANSLDNIASRSLTNEGKVNELATSLDHLESDVSAITSVAKSLETKGRRLNTSISTVTESIASLQAQHTALRSLVDETIKRNEDDVSTQINNTSEIREVVQSIEGTISSLLKRTDVLDSKSSDHDQSLADALLSLSKRPIETERREENVEAESVPGDALGFTQRVVLARTRQSEKTSVQLNDSSSILQALEDSYQSVGVPARPAAALSREVFCGLVCDQVIFLRGLFANIVALATTRAIASGNCFHASVPIGAVEDRSLLGDNLIYDSTDRVPCILLRNANRSPFEGYGQALIDRSLRKFLNSDVSGRPAFVIATIDDGAAGLPLYPGFLSAGPIIETNTFGWRRKKTDEMSAANGYVDSQDWEAITEQLDDRSPGSSESFDELVNSLSLDSTSIRRLRWQYSYLLQICDSSRFSTALQSLAFGWIVPRLSGSYDLDASILAEFGDGRLDADSPDTRLRELLSTASDNGEHL